MRRLGPSLVPGGGEMAHTERRRLTRDGLLDSQPDRAYRGKRCPESQCGGCDWCVTGYAKRPARRRARHQASAALRAA